MAGGGTVQVTVKLRGLWAVRLAGRLLTIPRVEVWAGDRLLGNQALPLRIVGEGENGDVEISKVEP